MPSELINGPDRVNLTTAGGQKFHVVVPLDDGASLVVYLSGADNIFGRFITTNGDPTGDEINISGSGFRSSFAPAAVRLGNGNIVVAYADSAGDTIAKIYSPTMQLISSTVLFDTTTASKFEEIDLTATSTGFAAVVEYARSTGDRDLRIATFSDAGARERIGYIALSDTYDHGASIASLTNGNLVVSFTRNTEATQNLPRQTDIRTIVYAPHATDPTAFAAAASIQILSESQYSSSWGSTVTALPNGGYLITGVAETAQSHVQRAFHATYDARGTQTGFTVFGDDIPQGSAISQAGYLVTYHDRTDQDDPRVAVTTTTGATYVIDLGGPTTANEFWGTAYWVNNYTVQIVYATTSLEGDVGFAIGTARYELSRQLSILGSTPYNAKGTELIDVFSLSAGDDTLDGAGGPDIMRGGSGNDRYYVENSGDVVDEISNAGDGYDTVYSWISYTLPLNVEALVLLGFAPINGTGNALNNTITGNGAANWIDGSFGADTMRGNNGNDTYVVDNEGDFVDEFSPGSGGWDTVRSSIDYVLGPNVEALVLTGSSGVDGKGNGLGNYIEGNGKVNALKGAGGNDTIKGMSGKDAIDGGNGSGDIASYADKAKVVKVTLDGSKAVTVYLNGKAEDTIKNIEGVTGGSRADTLVGDSRGNTFDGGLGKDIFTGKGGNDKFVFSTTVGPANADTITDFSHKHDKIALEDYLVGWFLGGGVEKAEFYSAAGATKAHDDDDRIIYNKTTGKLYVDVDGKGGPATAVLFATLGNHPGDLSHQDFAIV